VTSDLVSTCCAARAREESGSVAECLASFLPAFVVWPVWAYVMQKNDLWGEAFTRFYPMSLAMVAGCLIAGSTPLGGAVVAFPTAVLILKFDPAQGRDFAVLIQSVGMVAAAYLIGYRKRHLVDAWIAGVSIFANIFGILLGFELEVPGFWINVCYMTSTLLFAGLLMYKHACNTVPAAATANAFDAVRGMAATASTNVWRDSCQFDDLEGFAHTVARPSVKRHPSPESFDGVVTAGHPADATRLSLSSVVGGSRAVEEGHLSPKQHAGLTFGLLCCGVAGGFLSSKTGSGADMLSYVFGVFLYNSVAPKSLPESALAATSVVVMAACSVVVSVLRLVQGDISRDVYLCWSAALWIVVLGAPIGSLMLTPSREALCRRVFYVVALAQFVIFAVLQVRGNALAWTWIAVSAHLVLVVVLLHRRCCSGSKDDLANPSGPRPAAR